MTGRVKAAGKSGTVREMIKRLLGKRLPPPLRLSHGRQEEERKTVWSVLCIDRAVSPGVAMEQGSLCG